MVEQNTPRLNRLEQDLPEGLLVDGAWLEKRGYASNLRTYYAKNGWLSQPTRGVYGRIRGPLKWQQVIISLQTILEYSPLIVGGRTALELQGLTHYLSQDIREVHLYGPKAPPTWVHKLPLDQRFVYHNDRRLFHNNPVHYGISSLAWDVKSNRGRDLTRLQGGDVTSMAWGQWDWPLTLSTPERAVLELLDELPSRESFHHADKIMEGLSTLSPRRMQKLLADCASVKVKRLFFFFADRQGHAWLKRLDRSAIDLGSGKRMLAKGGRYDPVYQITVPGDLDANQ
ncbi:transcriptional regulator with AbiEi antitoxin domain of type IV toxin-antitoxin system [Hoeflea marina]|uniref:Transcriptional regulator with AbiEi antitoxin domain of type IV toxin-antitoxin system n=1 Tax=Hoeflea marina TaxID=274592 RepID=A0A317PS68_9HYPH|nr:type IV toxin-antitoxin system AbiEi family antitoxin [Hoeflea marina]PWW03797.1 transcriptional regulator with AbiEi antitoxin domain of type IV toxin-antitoxin system [Hoeflea marina]